MAKFAKKFVLVINGPNMNLLGKRKPEIYGDDTLHDLENMIINNYKDHDVNIGFYQSNHEGEIIDKIQESDFLRFDTGENLSCGIVINPGAFAHYSYAIRDAIEAIKTPVVEVHMSDVYKREDFRKNMVLSDVCKKTIIGKGIKGYYEAIDLLLDEDKQKKRG